MLGITEEPVFSSMSTTANPILFGHNKAASQTYSAATLFNNTSNTKG